MTCLTSDLGRGGDGSIKLQPNIITIDEAYLLRLLNYNCSANPVEDVWLQAKRFIREFYHLCKSFSTVKWLFEFVTDCQTFDFPKVFKYGTFS